MARGSLGVTHTSAAHRHVRVSEFSRLTTDFTRVVRRAAIDSLPLFSNACKRHSARGLVSFEKIGIGA
jgi:hypothetical protein